MDSLRLFVCMISLCICAYAGDKRNANVLEDNIVDSVIRTSRTPIAVSEDRAVTKGARRATEVWSQCFNITAGLATVDDVCVSLLKGSDCGVTMKLTIAGLLVKEEDLADILAPKMCFQYTLGFSNCDVCVSINDSPTSPQTRSCAFVNVTCLGYPFPGQEVGCFDKSRLDDIISCEGQCPAGCSGHGFCGAGSKCQCDAGYFGDDCSSQVPTGVCVPVLADQVCCDLTFEGCDIAVSVSLDSIPFPLFTKTYSVQEFRAAFSEKPLCVDGAGCQYCLQWSDLVMSTSVASGCGTLKYSCFGQTLGTRDLGCFNDTSVIPECLSTCPNKCSGDSHGTCKQGICQCRNGYSGDDCSKLIPVCASDGDCNDHGTCDSGICRCKRGWEDTLCSRKVPSGTTSKSPSSSLGITVGIVIGVVVLLIIVAVIAVLWWRRSKSNQGSPSFTRLEFLDDDDNGGDGEEDDEDEAY